MSEILNEKLNELRYLTESLSNITKEALANSIEALKQRNKEMCQRIIESDDEIDCKSSELEKKSLETIATQQPAAEDLRLISAILFINIDLERIADHAANIAKEILKIADEPHLKPLIDIPRMKDICLFMLDDAIIAFKNKDSDLALKTREKDQILDEIKDQIFRELLTYMMEDPKSIKRATALLSITQCLERVGDHITNICERIFFFTTGSYLRNVCSQC